MARLWSSAGEHSDLTQAHEVQAYDLLLKKHLNIQFRPIPTQESTASSEDLKDLTVVLVKDVSESSQIEQLERQTTAELQAIFEVMPEQFIRLGLNGTIRAQRRNDKSEDPFITEEAIGKKIQDLYIEEIGAKFQKAIEEVVASESLVMLEYSIPRQEGEQTYEARLLPLLEDQIILIIRNITEKVRLYSMAQTMDLMRNLGFIFSGIRHEIGNPINAIKMTMSVLQKNIDRYPREKVLEYIDRVLTEINRVEYLLKNLKNFNMFEEVKPVSIDLEDFMEKFLALLQKDYEKQGITIKKIYDSKAKVAFADPRALHQVLLNIMSNAAESLETIEAPLIQIITRDISGKKQIIITDNGVGIAPAKKKNIFQPFFTTKPEGTGLGLNIVQKILSRMNGTIDIRSVEHSGTTVIVSIPGG
jgi:signal transduction histidine kinase